MPKETLDFISFVPWTFVVMIINLYILYRIIRRFLFKPVQDIIKKRQEDIDGIFTEAESAKIEADKAKQCYENKLSEVHTEASEVIENAMKSAQNQEDKILKNAQQKAKVIVQKAYDDAELAEVKASEALKDDISDMAIDIARKITMREINQSDHEKLIKDCLEQFRGGTA